MPYFNFDRKRKATEDIKTCYACAEKAGIKDNLFILFGVLLGIVREGDFLGSDDDVDMCIKSDGLTKEQIEKYMQYLTEAHMFEARKKVSRRRDTLMPTWFTLRKAEKRAKFCHWVGFEFQNFFWWSKSGRWVTPRKFDLQRWGYDETTEGLALGIPADYVKKLMWIDFRGVKVQIPEKYGHALDWFYPGWVVPAKGSSRKQVVLVIKEWANQRTWKVKMG